MLDYSNATWVNGIGGRQQIKTNIELTGVLEEDIPRIKTILQKVLPIHQDNASDMDTLFSVFYGNMAIKEKSKTQRSDINNKVSSNNALSIVRKINSYCFGEQFKYLANDTKKNQEVVERLNEIMQETGNYVNTIRTTLNSAICGIGYKIALPSNDDEIPFKINGDIDPRKAFCVYSDEIIPECIMGVFMQDSIDEKGKVVGTKYTVWTKKYQIFLLSKGKKPKDFEIIPQTLLGNKVSGYPLTTNQVPLIEVRRNKFALGDYELVLPLMDAKNKLLSNRIDDIDQIIDYLLVLTNCTFESEEDKNKALTTRLLQIKSANGIQGKPSVDILKNSLDQTAVQSLADYIDSLIQEIVGIPSREERSSGGDTGQAVKFRNGFRDLEDDAGMIVPEMESAEKKFVKVCLSYCNNLTNNPLGETIQSKDIKVVFKRTLSDDPVASGQAFNYFVTSGMDYTDALIASKAVSDPAEVGARCKPFIKNPTSANSSKDNKLI